MQYLNLYLEGIMATSDQMSKYLQKKDTYKAVDTIDKVYKKALDKADKDQKKNKKKMDKLLIRDNDGREILIKESEDGVMTYFTGQGNYHKAIRYGKRPHDISPRARLHNLQFSKEILAAEGVLTPEIESSINDAMSGI